MYSDAEIIEIENVRLLETAAAARLDFRGHSDGTTTYGFQKITIKDVFQEYTPISIVPFGSYQSFVKQLHIENVKFATYSASPFPLYVEDHNIEKAVLKDIYLPESSAVNCSYLGLKAGLANITTNIDLKRIYSKVTLSYLANLYDDGSSGFSISGTLDMRELQLLTVRLVTATVVNNLTIKQVNSGTATITAGNTSVTVSHGLVSTPSKVIVTPIGDPGARFWVANKTATTFDIVVAAAPTADIQFDWEAEV